MTDTVAMLERLAAAPKPFVTVLRFSDGTVDRIGQPRLAMAENMAARYRGKVGRTFRRFDLNGSVVDYSQPSFPTLTAVETEGF